MQELICYWPMNRALRQFQSTPHITEDLAHFRLENTGMQMNSARYRKSGITSQIARRFFILCFREKLVRWHGIC